MHPAEAQQGLCLPQQAGAHGRLVHRPHHVRVEAAVGAAQPAVGPLRARGVWGTGRVGHGPALTIHLEGEQPQNSACTPVPPQLPHKAHDPSCARLGDPSAHANRRALPTVSAMQPRVCEPLPSPRSVPAPPQGVQAPGPRCVRSVQARDSPCTPHTTPAPLSLGVPPCPRSRARRARLWRGRPFVGPAPGPVPRQDPVSVLVPGHPRRAEPQRQPPASAATAAPPPWARGTAGTEREPSGAAPGARGRGGALGPGRDRGGSGDRVLGHAGCK